MSARGTNVFVEVGPLADGSTGLSCSDFSTGLRLNLRQINGQGLDHALSGPFSGVAAQGQIGAVLEDAMGRIGEILKEHGVHLIQKPAALDRDM